MRFLFPMTGTLLKYLVQIHSLTKIKLIYRAQYGNRQIHGIEVGLQLTNHNHRPKLVNLLFGNQFAIY